MLCDVSNTVLCQGDFVFIGWQLERVKSTLAWPPEVWTLVCVALFPPRVSEHLALGLSPGKGRGRISLPLLGGSSNVVNMSQYCLM